MQIKHLDTNKAISTVYKSQLDISGERHDWSPLINYCMGLETGLWTGAGRGKIGPESQAATNLRYHSALPLLLPLEMEANLREEEGPS